MEQIRSAKWQDRIVKDPKILAGKPVVKGTRISVELITDLLEGSHTEADILNDYPHITRGDTDACRHYKATGTPLSSVTWSAIDDIMDGAQKPEDR